jgi:uncharacterized protein YndB with AHSA1/START domain
MAVTTTDRIEKRVLLSAPRFQVWKALTDSEAFGKWFGVKFDGPFVAGKPLRGTIVPTTVDDDVARMQKPYEGTVFEIVVDRIEPQRVFSFRWHPYAVEPTEDYSAEPMTVVLFMLEDAGTGTSLTVSESGFDKIPASRRAKAFESNEGGWTMQMKLIEKYVSGRA